MEKKPEEVELFKQSGVTGKISDIKAYVKFEQASKTSDIKVSFGKFEGITKKHGLHIHTYSDFQASGKHLGGKKIPYDKVRTVYVVHCIPKVFLQNGFIIDKTATMISNVGGVQYSSQARPGDCELLFQKNKDVFPKKHHQDMRDQK